MTGRSIYEAEWAERIAPNLEAIRQSLERGGGAPDDEAHWDLVRQQFTFDHAKGHLNTGTIGASPLYVRRKVEMLREEYERNPWIEMGRVHGERSAAAKVAELLNVAPGEISFTQNITHSMLHVAMGLQLRRGDLVVTTDQEHHGGSVAWDLAADWNGATVVKIPIPQVPERPETLNEQIVARFRETFERHDLPRYARKKKLLSVSHLFSPLARRMPVKPICALARHYGYLTYLDGAQTVGQVRLDLRDIGCDFYGNSPHKWLLAPKGTGILYVRSEATTQLRPYHPRGYWHSWGENVPAHVVSTMGTIDPAAWCGVGFAVDFLNLIGGIDRVEARGWRLSCRLRKGIAGLPGLQMITPHQPLDTPPEHRLAASMSAYLLDGAGDVGDQLRTRYDLHFPASDRWGRVSTHHYTTPAQVDRLIAALTEIANGGGP